MTPKAITSGQTDGQKKQLKRFVEDAFLVLTSKLDELDGESAQRIIESGNKLPKAFQEALQKLGRRKPDDTRVTQAKRLYDLKFNGRLKGKDLWEAFLATIPEIPDSLLEHDPDFPLLTLVYPVNGLVKTCELALVKDCGVSNLEPYSPRDITPAEPHWIRAHDGRVNRGKKPSVCREEAVKRGFFPGTAEVGLAIWIHHQSQNVAVEGEHVMDLPGSVHRGNRSCCAYLLVWYGSPKLHGFRDDDAHPQCGAVVFRRE